MRLAEEEREHLLAHISQWLGPVEGVLSVPVQYGEAMELAHVPPTEHKPWHVWVSIGMSRYAMPVPEGEPGEPYAELMLGLPVTWPVEQLSDPAVGWPLRLLAECAAFPETHERWLGSGHTIPNGEPPTSFHASTHYCASLIAPPLTCLPEFNAAHRADGSALTFHALLPLFIAELELKLNDGTNALLARFDKAGVNEIIDFERKSVAGVLLELMQDS